jgi:hypothetical protein
MNLQALTEWHLFSQFTGTKIDLFDQKNSFAKFWQSCVDRIGEPTAKGWRNYHERELHPNNAYYIREQEDLRKQTTEIIRFERKELIPAFKRNGIPYINIYRKLEMFRQQRYWSPIHYKHDDLNLFMVSLFFCGDVFLIK